MLPINLRAPSGGDGRQSPFTDFPDELLATLSWISLALFLAMVASGLLGLWLNLGV